MEFPSDNSHPFSGFGKTDNSWINSSFLNDCFFVLLILLYTKDTAE